MLNLKPLAFGALCILLPSVLNADGMASSKAKLNSMLACKKSFTDVECDLQALDPSYRELLEKIEKLKEDLGDLKAFEGNSLSGSYEYFIDTVNRGTADLLTLEGGSVWSLNSYYTASFRENVVGVFTGPATATLVIDENTYSATLVKGQILKSTGIVASVIDERGEGAFLELDNGTYLSFDSYDAYDTGWWVPPYQVLVDETTMTMWRLDDGSKVYIESIK